MLAAGGHRRDHAHQPAHDYSRNSAPTPGSASLMVAGGAETPLQIVVGPRQAGGVVAVEQARRVAGRDLLELFDGWCQRPERILPVGHLLEQILVRSPHGSSRSFFMIGQDVRCPVNPLVGLADRRPQRSRGPKPLRQEAPKVLERYRQPPFSPTRSIESWMAARRPWSYKPEAASGRRPSSVSALLIARQWPRMASAYGSLRPSSARSIGLTPRSCFLSSFLT